MTGLVQLRVQRRRDDAASRFRIRLSVIDSLALMPTTLRNKFEGNTAMHVLVCGESRD